MSIPITRPLLPPKAGYVEVIDENGNHVYKPTPETEAKLQQETEAQALQTTVNQMLVGANDVQSQPEPQAALEFNKVVQLFAATLADDETAMMEIASIYPPYRVGVAYKVKDIFSYGKNSVGDPQLYQVLQAHTSAAEWTPDTAVSLYKKVGVSDDGTPIWVQPLGATDAYNIGDQVMYNGKKYKSIIAANVWSPDAYPAGWELLEDTEPTDPEEPTPEPEPDTPDVPEFVQPTGAHDAYKLGDRVLYNGQVYESLMNGNVYSPDAYPAGWQLVTE